MSESSLTEDQKNRIQKVYDEWMEEAKKLAELPEDDYQPYGLDCHHGVDRYALLTKKYQRKIREIKGTLPKQDGEAHGGS